MTVRKYTVYATEYPEHGSVIVEASNAREAKKLAAPSLIENRDMSRLNACRTTVAHERNREDA